eukprot:15468912-Alexandrium_andersonii.AAC.1
MRAVGMPGQFAERLDAQLAATGLPLNGFANTTISQQRQLLLVFWDGGFGFQSALLSATPAMWVAWHRATPAA